MISYAMYKTNKNDQGQVIKTHSFGFLQVIYVHLKQGVNEQKYVVSVLLEEPNICIYRKRVDEHRDRKIICDFFFGETKDG